MGFAQLSRLRKNSALRDLSCEAKISTDDFILPYFALEGKNKKEIISSLPGVLRLSIDNLIKDVGQAKRLGIKAVLIFGVAKHKDERAAGAFEENGIIQKAVRAIRQNIKDITILTDVCLCGFTGHGHCRILKSPDKFIVDNHKTLATLAKIALSHAQAGADFVAPSAMADGQVKFIREALDKNGFLKVGILAYSAKFASNFYGPFREALNSSPRFGDRTSYQLNYSNSNEALREIEKDIQEGADIVMVKPAWAYLDIIYQAKQKFNVPLAAFNVSGEFAMLEKYRGKQKEIVLEVLTAIKRAGADLIISYHAKEAAKWLKKI